MIRNQTDLADVASSLENSEFMGVDLETTSLSPRDGRIRLLQLSTADETFVIDVFEVKNLSPLKKVLEDGPVKILQNSKFDYQFLFSEHGIRLSPLFDTMLAAQLLDGGAQGASYSLEAIAERYLDEQVDKSVRKDDWSGDLSESQLEYAARDAAILLPLRDRLHEELEKDELV